MSKKTESMRIIAGKYRHRLISFPSQEFTRPTKDRVREAIFSSLGDLTDCAFLDLFAGSGAMGIEALSRGATKVTFVDLSKGAVKVIKNNLNSLDIRDDVDLYNLDYKEALINIKNIKQQYDVIFLDPPYKEGDYEGIVNYCLDNDILSTNGIIVCESDRNLNIDESKFRKVKNAHYGEIQVNYYRR